jgi:low affinity Fe/Cu permease
MATGARNRPCIHLYSHLSDTGQLVMNTLTNVIPFLMVFLTQTSQNRDSNAQS